MDWEELKTKWLEALRSGEYKQARRNLRGANGFCCLGVLCDIFPQGEWDHQGPGAGYSVGEPGTGSATIAPTDWFPGWVGFVGTEDEAEDWYHFEDALASENDAGATFEELADIIERGLMPDAESH